MTQSVAGLQAPDRYTLRIRLNAADANFPFAMAYGGLAAVAREVIILYGTQKVAPGRHWPVPAQAICAAQQNRARSQPDYRALLSGISSRLAIRRMRRSSKTCRVLRRRSGGWRFPLSRKEQSRWLAFQEGKSTLTSCRNWSSSRSAGRRSAQARICRAGLAAGAHDRAGGDLHRIQFQDPVTGGFSRENVALRRAIAMAYSVDDEIALLRRGQASRAH